MTETHFETLTLPAPDGDVEAYLARPGGGAPAPGVLFFMDVIGLRPQIRSMVERVASWGYTVLAPNMLYRAGSAAELEPQEDLREQGGRERFMQGAMGRLETLDTAAQLRDIPAYLTALREQPGVGAEVAVVGFCAGARLAMRATGLDHDVVAMAGFHAGGLVTDADDSPHHALTDARAEFVLGHATDDRSMPQEAVDALGATFAEHGLTASNEVYDGPHGYSMADTTMYDEGAAERAMSELEALLRRTLPAG